MMNIGRLLISCPDKPGIVAIVSQFIFQQGGNILQSNQYSTDSRQGSFFMRIEFELIELKKHLARFRAGFEVLAKVHQIIWQLETASQPKRMALFVSKEDHCLRELLWQWQAGDLHADIRMVVSNYDISRTFVESLGISYHYLPISKESKEQVEDQQLRILSEAQIDVIGLARYMQILSPNFLDQCQAKVINIHHSFLPAFIGNNPYQRAYQRGVKLIGATAHYVTTELDEGPIIEQDVHRVDHQQDVQELKRIGRQVERSVFARAIRWHLEDRVIVHENKTIIFA